MRIQGQHKNVFMWPFDREVERRAGRFGKPDRPRISLFWISADKNPDKHRFSLENSREVFCVLRDIAHPYEVYRSLNW